MADPEGPATTSESSFVLEAVHASPGRRVRDHAMQRKSLADDSR